VGFVSVVRGEEDLPRLAGEVEAILLNEPFGSIVEV
jgi:hypothetical protein